MSSKKVLISLEPELLQKIDEIARARFSTRSNLIRQVMVDYVELRQKPAQVSEVQNGIQ